MTAWVPHPIRWRNRHLSRALVLPLADGYRTSWIGVRALSSGYVLFRTLDHFFCSRKLGSTTTLISRFLFDFVRSVRSGLDFRRKNTVFGR
jgi:hypothetical protein